jgi:hypothetical protein
MFKIAARAFGNENVSVNLHHLRLRQAGALVQVVHVLGNEQKFIRTLRQFANRFMGGIRLRIANALAPRYHCQTNSGSRTNASAVANFIGSRLRQ